MQESPSAEVREARIEAIEKLGGPISLPTPALAEFLSDKKISKPLSDADRRARLEQLGEFLVFHPFDSLAALEAAKLLGRKPPRGHTRQQFKVDTMIYAVAVAVHATHFVHRDDCFEKLAGISPPLKLVDVATMPVQTPLPLKRAESPERDRG